MMTVYLNKNSRRWMLLLITVLVSSASGWLHLTNIGAINAARYQPTNQTNNGNIKVFTPDWGVGSTLVKMNNAPIAIGDKRMYPVWVGSPQLPEEIIDIGMRGQPNVELLAQLNPDVILDTFFYSENRSVYNPDIPVYEINFTSEDHNTNQLLKWSDFVATERKIGSILDKLSQADKHLKDSRQRILESGKKVRQYIGDDQKILVAEFWDARQLNFNTINSHTSLAAKMMGFDIVTIGASSRWGSSSVPMHTLYELPKDVCFIIAEPIPETIKYEIAHSPIWQRSPFFGPDACVYKIEPVWANGGVEVMVTFAENLEQAVITQNKNEFSHEYVAHRNNK